MGEPKDPLTEKLTVEVSQADFDKIEKVMADATAKFIEELPTMIQQRLQGAVAKILGFENSWGEWKVDHCNGRMSVMSEYIGNKARAAATAAVDKIDFKSTAEIDKAIKQEYADYFKSELRERIREHAEQQVQMFLDRAARAHVIEVETLARVPTKKEIGDPNLGKRPLEKLIMESIVTEKIKLKEGAK